MQNIHVYYAAIPEGGCERELYPKERMEEIQGCKNEVVRREKYRAWEILKFAVQDALKLRFDNLQFTKLPTGQWICGECFFSISHSDGAVTVAVSDLNIGIDIEPIRAIDKRLLPKVLTENELACYGELSEDEKERYLLECWCKKEAIFKASHGDILIPKEIECQNNFTDVYEVKIGDKQYLLAIAARGQFESWLKSVEELPTD